ncbi:MAG TPA: nitrate reductase molybdenum cofactor assembly chaperone [Sphingomicrobium sp.]|nr:nitrate reductase molybdenum cofactor assembly chaperone [Sphingomicrobium sp.]
MKLTLRALAAMLGYPSEELKTHAGELRQAIEQERALSATERSRLEPLIQALETDELLDLQADYSELFDRSRSLSLHLFEHVHGDNRERGQAMIDLGQQYLASGFFLEANELPDFVPVFLEYASCLPPSEARETLGQPAHVFAALDERLGKRQSPYASIFHCLVVLSGVRPEVEALAEIDKNTPAVDPSEIDEEWEEAPVSFNNSGPHEMGGPTGVVAKIRASNRSVSREASA